jgi:ribosomal peptide maturation radical SAM protein 1
MPDGAVGVLTLMQGFDATCDRVFESMGTDSDAVLIVPPFADLHRPSYGIHLLQATAERAGLRVRVLYANHLFAALVGQETYSIICDGNNSTWGNRVFAATAFGLPPLGYATEKLREQTTDLGPFRNRGMTFEKLAAMEGQAGSFCAALGERLAKLRLRVVGATSMFQQTPASIALLTQIKRRRPDVITALGGANCEGEMANGIASLGAPIDYIFSGECESVFPRFLRQAVDGAALPTDHIVRGEACFDLDALPEPNFNEYFTQLDDALPGWRETQDVALPYESSRGCWWGARQHCTFCGLNGETMAHRQKSPDRMIQGTRRLLSRYPTRILSMIDNIMPHSYFRTMLPRLERELPPREIFYETKSNLNLEQVVLLRRAGVNRIQPGIEALSSSLLQRMKKGVLARQNLALMRYARAVGLSLSWNLLYDFPADQAEDYESTIALMPLIHHLPPPRNIFPVSIDRFSPYFDRPAEYGVSNLRPADGYFNTFPPTADLQSLAYHFKGEYATALSTDPKLYAAFERGFCEWRGSWKVGSPPPSLSVADGSDGYYTLMDTRGLEGTEVFQFVGEDEARAALIGGPLNRQPLAEWAIERKLAVALDGWCVPLAITDVETWRSLESLAPQTVSEVPSAAGEAAGG